MVDFDDWLLVSISYEVSPPVEIPCFLSSKDFVVKVITHKLRKYRCWSPCEKGYECNNAIQYDLELPTHERCPCKSDSRFCCHVAEVIMAYQTVLLEAQLILTIVVMSFVTSRDKIAWHLQRFFPLHNGKVNPEDKIFSPISRFASCSVRILFYEGKAFQKACSLSGTRAQVMELLLTFIWEHYYKGEIFPYHLETSLTTHEK